MKNTFNYVPKKSKANYKIVVPFVLVVMAIIAYLVTDYNKKLEEQANLFYKVCDYSADESEKVLRQRQTEYIKQETILLGDFTYYGESLTLYEEKFELGNVDGFSGNTIFLRNLCQTSIEDKTPYLISNDKDVGIEVMNLEDGIYEVEILSDFKFKRFFTEDTVDDIFMSAQREGKIKEVRLLSNKEVFNKNHEEAIFDKNYLFIVVETIYENDEIDVILNPARLTEGDYGNIDQGHLFEDLAESEETYKMARRVKEILEEKGVRVALSRNNTYPINNFGEDSRVQEAYEMKAKYMVNMRLETSGSMMDHGIVVLYSNSSSNRFALTMAEKLIQGTSLVPSPYFDRNNPAGVFQTALEEGFDYNDIIRETGGRITGAGQLREFSELSAYAKDINQGINTIDVLYGFMTHPDDLKTWKTEFEQIAQMTSQAILSQMGLQGD